MVVIGQHHAPAVLPSGKNAQYPLVEGRGSPRISLVVLKKCLLPLLGIKQRLLG